MNKKTLLFIGTTIISTGLLIFNSFHKQRTAYCGVLRIDDSAKDYGEPEQIFLELQVPISQLASLQIASFKILKQNYICAKKTTSNMDDKKS